jgi:ATP-dependent DNA ligase
MQCDHRSWRLKLVSRQGTNVFGWFPGKLGQMPSDVSGFEILLEGEVIVGNGSVESFKAIRARPNSLTMARLRR